MTTLQIPQKTYDQYHQPGYVGDLAGQNRTIRSAQVRNNTALDMVYGLMVACDAAGIGGSSRAIRPIAAATDVLSGILTRQRIDAPGPLDAFGINGLRPNGDGIAVLAGSVLVEPEQTVTVADPVYVRWGAGSESGHDTPGTFRKDADVVPAWIIDHAYTKGARVTNDTGKVYQCITAGTSAHSGGPTGTTADITDNTAHWMYVGLCSSSDRSSAVLVPNARFSQGTADCNLLVTSGLAIVEVNMP